MIAANTRESDRALMARIIAHRPRGLIARRVEAFGVERELDLWAIQRAMTTVHQIDLRRWVSVPQFKHDVRAVRRELWNAYLSGYLGVNDDAESG